MHILYLIPARGGSKRLPNKNIKPLGGKLLIQHTIDAARSIAADSDICISTDSDEIAEAAENIGLRVPFRRPPELATDQSGSHDVIIHALDFFKDQGKAYDVVALLQPTSPFRTGDHIRGAIEQYAPDVDMVVSVARSHLNPHFNLFKENDQGFLQPFVSPRFERSQDCPEAYAYNGAIYLIKVEALRNKALHTLTKVRKFVMSDVESLDIDTPLDWLMAETIIGNPTVRFL